MSKKAMLSALKNNVASNRKTVIVLGLLLTLLFVRQNNGQAQNTFPATGSVGIGTTAPNASAAIDITSTTKGALVPRMTTAQKRAIATPATGLLIYQIDSVPGFYYYTGTAWWPLQRLIAGAGISVSGDTIKNTLPKLVAGNSGITVSGDTIRNTVPQLYAGTGITITHDSIAATLNKLVAGPGITISGDTVKNTLPKLVAGNSGITVSGDTIRNTVPQLYAGTGITITHDSIAATINKLVAGPGITISGDTVKNTLPKLVAGNSGITVSGDTIRNTVPQLFAGTGITITNDTVKATLSKLVAGTGINVSGDTVSTTPVANNNWNLTGNAGTTVANFIGTTDGQPIHFKSSGLPVGTLNWTTGTVAFGDNALGLGGTGLYNNAIGGAALYNNQSGGNNSAVGYGALEFNVNGNTNNAFGSDALNSNTSGYSNVAIGASAIVNSKTDHNLVAIGDSALYNINASNGSANTAVGSKTLYSNSTGINNTATGFQTLYSNTTANDNTANGYEALRSNTTGAPNDAFGFIALNANQTGNDNAAFGAYSLQFSSQSFNTGIGVGAISQITTGSNNTALGYNAGQNLTGGSNNIMIGSSAKAVSTTGSNQLNIGNWIYGSSGNISIGTTAANQQLTVNNGLNVDQVSGNPGQSLKNGITFGNSSGSQSGEGLASNRSGAGLNQFGVDFYTDYKERVSITNSGYVGIGTTAPLQPLSINNGMNIDQSSSNPGQSLLDGLTFGANGTTGPSGEGIASNRSTSTGNNEYGLDFYTDYTSRMSITNGGNVGIGVFNPYYKLDVCGTIRGKEVLVQTGWCDYVFDKNYNLRPIEEVQQYIEQNKHLPDVPSAEEVATNGVKVAQMDSIMIKKIEELTLYVVQQNSQIEQLQKKVEKLEAQNSDLKKENQ